MPLLYKGRVKEVASNKPNASTAFSLPDSAPASFRSFDAAYATGEIMECYATNGTDWEEFIGTFTAGSPDTLARTTLLDSSTGSAIDWSSGGDVTIFVTPSARSFSDMAESASVVSPGGRLTTNSTSAIGIGSSPTVYYLPHTNNLIRLKENGVWRIVEFASLSLTLTGNAANTYDIFVYLNSGVPTLELLAWTNSTTRAVAYQTIAGLYYKSGDDTRLLLGTVYFDGTNVVDSSTIGGICNAYNKIFKGLSIGAGNTPHTYASSTMRIYNNSTTQTRLRKVICIGDEYMHWYKFGTTDTTGCLYGVRRDDTSNFAESRSFGTSYEGWSLYYTTGSSVVGYRFFDLGERTDGASGSFNYGILTCRGEA